MTNNEPDFTDPNAAARYAIGAAAELTRINMTRVAPAMLRLRSLRRRMPRADASDEAWGAYFARVDRQENQLIDAIRDLTQVKLNIVAATLPHVIAGLYRQPSSDAPGSDPWQIAGYSDEKAATMEAIDVLAQVGFSWGNGFANGSP